MKQLIPSKLCKLLVLILSVLVVAGFAGCSGKQEPSDELLVCTVASDSLDVHKKASASSRVLGQLPFDLEIEILEQKTVKETNWGRIDKMKLADGTKIKAGWVDLQYVKFPGDEEPEETEPSVDLKPDPAPIVINMGTVTANKLNIRKGPDSGYETDGAYYQGDRIEILETKNVGDTLWGRTNLGWIGMGYVKMDGTASSTDEADPIADMIVSNGSTDVLGYGVVDLGELNVRLGPGMDYDKIGTVKLGVRYAYYQISNVSGNWARIENGWVSTDYFYLEGTTAEDQMTGVVTTDDLNIRTGPDTSFQSTGTYQMGETIEILAQVGAWGCTDKGWVFMNYVEPAEPTYTTGTGTITSGLNIRKEPNPDAEIVGAYSEGDGVIITEVEGNWGKTVQGWINLKYVEFN